MPNQNEDLQQLSQLFQLFQPDSHQAALQQQAQQNRQSVLMHMMSLREQATQHAAEQDYHNRALAQTDRYHNDSILAQQQERKASVFGQLLGHHLATGGKLQDFTGLSLLHSMDPETAQMLTESAAHETANRHLATLAPLLQAHALKPSVDTQKLIEGQMSTMGMADPIVQQYIPWQQLNDSFSPYGRKGASIPLNADKVLEANPGLRTLFEQHATDKQNQLDLNAAVEKKVMDERSKNDLLQQMGYPGQATTNPFSVFNKL